MSNQTVAELNPNLNHFEVVDAETGKTVDAYVVPQGGVFNLNGVEVVGTPCLVNVGNGKGDKGAGTMLRFNLGEDSSVGVWDFSSMADSANPPIFLLPNGEEIEAPAMCKQMHDLTDIEPAAGPEAPQPDLAAIEPAAGPAAGATFGGFVQPFAVDSAYVAPDPFANVPGFAFADTPFGPFITEDLPTPPNVPPSIPPVVNNVVADDDSFSVVMNNPLTGTVFTNDYDPQGDAFSVTANTSPSSGTLVLNPNGTFTYTPNANFTGTDSFTYTVTDARGATDTAIVTINVGANSVDAVNDDFTIVQDNTLSGSLFANNGNGVDNDPQGHNFVVTNNTNPANGTVSVNADGTFTYTPNAGYNGTDTFTYTITDAFGATDTATVTINVGANSVDAINDAYSTLQGSPVSGNVIVNDVDPQGDNFTVTGNTSPANGSVVINADGTFTYTPNASFTGADTFTYTITDDHGATDTATVTINVAANTVDAVNDSFTTIEDHAVSGSLFANNGSGVDNDPQGHTFTVTGNTNPANGSVVVNADGTFTYTPNAGYNGTDTFTYTITDQLGAIDTATVTINVAANSVDARNDSYTTAYDTNVSGNVLTNDFDPQGDNFTVTGNTNPSNGSVTVNADGTFTYNPDANFSGTDTFTYTITDEHGATDTATVTINVAANNNSVNAVNDSYSTAYDTNVSGNVLTNDSDPQGDNFTVTSNTNPSHGSVTVNADGTFTYNPDANFSGTDTFNYTITDEHGATDTATVTINVAAPPVPTYNVSIVIDNSSSMFDQTVGGKSAIAVAKEAAVNLINDYRALGADVTFSVIAFSSSASVKTFSVDNYNGAINYINGIGKGSSTTSTAAALTTAQNHLSNVVSADPTDANHTNEVYFLSDFDANTAISQDHAASWHEFIGSNQIASHAVGINSGTIRLFDLNDVDNTGNYQIISNGSQLTTDGTNNGDFGSGSTVNGNSSNNTLRGHGGNDTLDGKGGADKLYGGAGQDTLIYDSADTVIHGGANYDTLKLNGGSVSLNMSQSRFQSIEHVDMTDGSGNDHLTINASDVLSVSDMNLMVIDGERGDSVTTNITNYGGHVTGTDGVTRAYYSGTGGAQLLVELGLNLNGHVVS